MIKFYKVKKSNILLVVDTVNLTAAPFVLNDKLASDLTALAEWWGYDKVSDYCVYSQQGLIECIIDGIEEIK